MTFLECIDYSKFKVDRVSEKVLIPELRVKNMGDNKNLKNRNKLTRKKFDKTSYFLNNLFLSRFTEEDISFVKNELNLELIDKLDYKDVLNY